MELLYKYLFYISGFIIVWAMVGYPISLKLIGRLYKNRNLEKNYSHEPTVTVMVVAHNEEKVILDKLNNILELDYPKDKIEFLIASDNSTDKTNEIVREFIKENQDRKIRIYEVKARKGKTNAQNEAQKKCENRVFSYDRCKLYDG
ncbi:glycosyltransferase [Bacillus cereus]